ncbi:chromate transporter [Janibacter anophelis]|uniref:chromate transporter n=1 Tax=Janibacter anophelis TaxID=319054 RepID=UPI000DF00A54|nr:chromate transporter [Janibacter anophelis]
MSRRTRVLLVVLTALGLAVPALLFVARYPRWWTWIAQEQVPMTWFQSVTLVVAGVVSLAAWWIARSTDVRPRAGLLLLAVGFAALAFDERFAVHERVRDRVLAPRDVRLPGLTWIAPGDFLLLLVALVGLALLPVVIRSMGRERSPLLLLGLGVVLAVVSVGTDSVDPSTWTVEGERIQQSLEECVELWAGLAFVGAVTLRLMGLVDDLVRRATDRGRRADERWQHAVTHRTERPVGPAREQVDERGDRATTASSHEPTEAPVGGALVP